MRINHITSAAARPQPGLQLKTGYRVGLAGTAQTSPASDFRAGPLPGAAGIVIDPTPLIDLSQRFLEWLDDWAADFRLRQLKKAGKIIDLPDLSRFYELDAARGLAILMMVLKHGLDSWGQVFSPRLARALLWLWSPSKVLLIGGISAFFMASALLESDIFNQLLNQWLPGQAEGLRVGLAWALAAAPALWMSLRSVGSSAFLFLSGMTLAVRAARQNDPSKLPAQFIRQGFMLVGLGLLVTALSLLLAPGQPIYFGILHLLGVATMLSLPFLSLPLPLVVASGLLISVVGALLPLNLPWWLGLGIVPVAMKFSDYTPIFPFMGLLLLGLAAGRTLYPDGRSRHFQLPDLEHLPLVRALVEIGRHSLLIYLAQEPFTLAGLARAAV